MTFDFIRQPIGAGQYEPEAIYLSLPFKGQHPLVQGWGERADKYGQYRAGGVALRGHNGIDFDLSKGTPVLAVDQGRIVEVGNDTERYGRYVRIQHRWGESFYAHLEGFVVESGQRIARGDRIGDAGSTGESDHPHLHFSIRIFPYDRADGWGGYTNPLPFLQPLRANFKDR